MQLTQYYNGHTDVFTCMYWLYSLLVVTNYKKINVTRYKNILSEKGSGIGFKGNGGIKMKGTILQSAKYRNNCQFCISTESLVPFICTPPLP